MHGSIVHLDGGQWNKMMVDRDPVLLKCHPSSASFCSSKELMMMERNNWPKNVFLRRTFQMLEGIYYQETDLRPVQTVFSGVDTVPTFTF